MCGVFYTVGLKRFPVAVITFKDPKGSLAVTQLVDYMWLCAFCSNCVHPLYSFIDVASYWS